MSIELTAREAQMLLDAIMFVWKSGAVQSREGASELISLEKRIEFYLYYIKNWSLLFDFKILFLTIWKGLINRHAY